MFYFVYSIYDKVSKQSVLITMHHTPEEAHREFDKILSNEQLASRKSDLDLVLIGEFNTSSLAFRTLYSDELPYSCEVLN